jgi:hypothetical protein
MFCLLMSSYVMPCHVCYSMPLHIAFYYVSSYHVIVYCVVYLVSRSPINVQVVTNLYYVFLYVMHTVRFTCKVHNMSPILSRVARGLGAITKKRNHSNARSWAPRGQSSYEICLEALDGLCARRAIRTGGPEQNSCHVAQSAGLDARCGFLTSETESVGRGPLKVWF